MTDLRAIIHKLDSGERLTVGEAERYIVDASPRTDATIFKGADGFQRSQYLMALLGNPQDSCRTIHVAGTSGKGSIVAMIASLLASHGQKVASYTSPHVYNLNERWCLNATPADMEQVVDLMPELYLAIKQMAASQWGRPTYFEIVTAIAFLLARQWQVDYAVIETGLGGLYDTTNTINRPDKIAVITELGFDHQNILGETLPEIAAHKAGIIPVNGRVLALSVTDQAARMVVEDIARQRHAELAWVDSPAPDGVTVAELATSFEYRSDELTIKNIELSLQGVHQTKNASLAIRALEFIGERDNLQIDAQLVQQALQQVHLPGRFELRNFGGKQLILDGAHNPQKLQALVAALQNIYPGQQFVWLMAFGKVKDCRQSLRVVAPIARRLIVTKFFANQDMVLSSKASSVEDVAAAARQAGIEDIVERRDNRQAFQQALAEESQTPIIVSGSFFLVGEIGRQLMN